MASRLVLRSFRNLTRRGLNGRRSRDSGRSAVGNGVSWATRKEKSQTQSKSCDENNRDRNDASCIRPKEQKNQMKKNKSAAQVAGEGGHLKGFCRKCVDWVYERWRRVPAGDGGGVGACRLVQGGVQEEEEGIAGAGISWAATGETKDASEGFFLLCLEKSLRAFLFLFPVEREGGAESRPERI